MNQELIDVSLIEENKGQIEGVPSNPRTISSEKMEALKRSIQNLPDMLPMRELLVYPFDGKYIVLAGNMRFRACASLGYTELPCKVIPEGTSPEKLRAIVIQDNNPYGETDWDMIANEWDLDELKEWSMDLPKEWEFDADIDNDKSATELGDDKDTELRIKFDTDTYARVIEALRVFDEKDDVALLKCLGLYGE